MDRDFNFIQVNEAYARSAGHPVDYFKNMNHFDLYPNEENQRIFQRVVDTGEPFSVLEKPFEYQEYPERGVTYWNWSLQPVQGGDGKVQGVVLSLVDVTERKRAEMLLERQNQELYNLSVSESVQRELAEGLVESMLVLNASLELDEVLKTILEQILRSIPYDSGSILLLENGKLTEVRLLDMLENPQQKFSAGNIRQLEDIPLFQAICSTHKPVLVEDTAILSQDQSTPGMHSPGSFMAAPMLIGDRVIGIIGLSSRTPGDFNQEYSRHLVAFTASAALAVENARLYSAELHARQVAETLSTAAKSLNQTLDFEQALGILLDHLQTIVPSDTAGITILEDQTRPSFHLTRSYGEWSGQEPKPSLIIDGMTDSLLSRLKDSRRSLIIPNLINPPAQEEVVSPGLLRYQLVVPIFFSGELIGMVELGKAGSQGFTLEQLQWAEALTDQAAVSLQNAWLYEQVRSKNETLKSLAHKLVEVQETERSYVARELHDEAGQVLSSLKIRLGRLEQDPLCPPIIQDGLRSLKYTTDSVLDEIHRLAMNLRPAVLDHLGLVAALEQHIKELQTEQLMVSFKAIGFEERRLPLDTETILYRIVQEALTNVHRHAQATSAGVLLEWCKEGMVRAFIEDDGTGFSQAPEEKVDRIGLIGMRERAEMLSGRLTVESSPGKGTSIVVEVPDGY
jgi:PAS domain S-box-containing protein